MENVYWVARFTNCPLLFFINWQWSMFGVLMKHWTFHVEWWDAVIFFANLLLFWHSYPRVSKVVEVGNIGSVMSSPFAFTISKVLVSYFNSGRPHHFSIFYFLKIMLYLIYQHPTTHRSPTNRGTECIEHWDHLITRPWVGPSLAIHTQRGPFLCLMGPRYILTLLSFLICSPPTYYRTWFILYI